MQNMLKISSNQKQNNLNKKKPQVIKLVAK